MLKGFLLLNRFYRIFQQNCKIFLLLLYWNEKPLLKTDLIWFSDFEYKLLLNNNSTEVFFSLLSLTFFFYNFFFLYWSTYYKDFSWLFPFFSTNLCCCWQHFCTHKKGLELKILLFFLFVFYHNYFCCFLFHYHEIMFTHTKNQVRIMWRTKIFFELRKMPKMLVFFWSFFSPAYKHNYGYFYLSH